MMRSFIWPLIACVAIAGCGKKQMGKLPRQKLAAKQANTGQNVDLNPEDPEQEIAAIYLTDWRSLPAAANHIETINNRAKQAIEVLIKAGTDVLLEPRLRVKLSPSDLAPDGTILPEVLERLRLAGVEDLDLNVLPITDAGMLQLQCLRCLKELRLQSEKVTDAGFAGLKPLIALQEFVCFAPLGSQSLSITGEGFKDLDQMKALKNFVLRRAGVKGAGLTYLSPLPSISTLYLDDNRITDAGLIHLVALSRLKFLSLEKNQIVGTGVKDLLRLGDLESLSLADCPIVDANAEVLGSLRVHALLLDGTKLTDAAAGPLSRIRALKVLRLSNTAFTNAGVKLLGGLPDLEELDLRGDKVTDGCLAFLAGCPKLQKVLVTKTPLFSLAAADKWKKTKPGAEVVFFSE